MIRTQNGRGAGDRSGMQDVRVGRVTVVPSTLVAQTSVDGEDVMVTAADGMKVLVRRHVAQPPGRCPFLCHEVRRIETFADLVGADR
jgi:hypothetical protein